MSDINTQYSLTSNDKVILRELARKVAELATRPIETEKRKLWYKHNALEETRPLIFCDPENGWKEIIRQEQLECVSELGKNWEYQLRKEIFWGDKMQDDRVIEPVFTIYPENHETGWGLDTVNKSVPAGGAYTWEAPLKDYKDFDKLRFPEVIVDNEDTNKLMELAKEVFYNILSVNLIGGWWWSLGLTRDFIRIRGLEELMYDVYDYPDEMHRLMKFLSDGYLRRLEFLENSNVLILNNSGHYVGSGGFGYTHELPQEGFNPAHIRTVDMWGFLESQETLQISPDMFEEFIFPYQLPILEKFGLNCYGCCEPLDNRWHIVKRIPRLRRVSVSPWASIVGMAEKLGADYIYSMKPIPTPLASPNVDKDFVRKNLREAIKATRNCRVEIIMKDNNTIGNNPQNVIDWTRIAKEEAQKV